MATYADLEVITKTYKEVNGHRILLDVLVPQDLKPGPNPLILSFHGGWFVAGSRNFLPFFPTWLPEFATRHSAIIISADYRLLPEASGAEILEDLESVWRWVHDSLQSVLTDHFAHKPGHTADLGRIMLYGGSAGGYCALQLALSHPDEVQALMMAYPMADVDGGWNVTGNGGADMLGRAPPSETEVDAFVAENKKPGAVATTGDWDRVRMGIGGQAWGKTRGWLGSGKDVVPFDRIKAGAGLPAKV
ncbi:hypothetical protein MMC17_001343 [Xylographa soralifera]|nr:hypothetical protein [Xylographa soralifera]